MRIAIALVLLVAGCARPGGPVTRSGALAGVGGALLGVALVTMLPDPSWDCDRHAGECGSDGGPNELTAIFGLAGAVAMAAALAVKDDPAVQTPSYLAPTPPPPPPPPSY